MIFLFTLLYLDPVFSPSAPNGAEGAESNL
jgi:hypothetical protein